MSIILRPYQQKAIDMLYDYMRSSDGNPCLVLPCGSGKSVLVASICTTAIKAYPLTRILMLTHVKELIQQNANKLLMVWPDAPLGIYSASIGQKNVRQITYAGIQSIARVPEKIGHTDIVIVDECFTGETKINTPCGKKRIDELMCGDAVYNAIGVGTISAVSKKRVKEIYNVRLSNGKEIRCTGNHPIFTTSGWVKAKNLEVGQIPVRIQDMQLLWKKVHTMEKIQRGRFLKMRPSRAIIQKAKILQDILLKEGGKRNVGAWRDRENVKNLEINGPQTSKCWWKWSRLDSATKNVFRNAWRGLDSRATDTDGRKTIGGRLSNMLQGGPWEQIKNACHRAGRTISLWKKKIIRYKERFILGEVRVESIESQKLGRSIDVFNLEVDGHPSYFADELLVHNCHLVSHKQTGQYRSLISYLKSINDKMVVIGLTATPWRLSHGLITDGDTIFDDIIEPVSIMELIDDGYLAPLRSKDTDTKIDTSGVHKRGGEFISSELQKVSDTDENNVRIAKEIVARAGDRKKWLVFCTGVDHAKHMSECLNALGVKSAYVHGGTPKRERERILNDHYAGNITALVNVQILSTGYDSPNVDLIAMVRTTLSLGLYFQITGRGTRLKDHTDHCLVLDFAGNVSIHGPITDPVLPRKKGNGTGKAPIKLCTICSEILHASARKCTCCGFKFPKVDKLAKMRFHNDDIMGIELNDMEVRSWYWEPFRSKKGNDMIRCRYSPKNLNDEPIIEYLAILNDGPAGAIAKNKLVKIANSAKVIIKYADNREQLCSILNDGRPPSIIRWRKNKKYKTVIEREWL